MANSNLMKHRVRMTDSNLTYNMIKNSLQECVGHNVNESCGYNQVCSNCMGEIKSWKIAKVKIL